MASRQAYTDPRMADFGLKRPDMGPMELKAVTGKTPVLNIGAVEKIKSGDADIVPGIKRFSHYHVELVDSQLLDLDAEILATGYRSNVPSWLQVRTNLNFDNFVWFLALQES